MEFFVVLWNICFAYEEPSQLLLFFVYFLLFVHFLEYISHYYQLLFFSIPFNITKIFDKTNSKPHI